MWLLKVDANDAYSAQNSTFSHIKEYIIPTENKGFKVMLLTDDQPYNNDVLYRIILTISYWWCQILSNDGNLFIHLIFYPY